MKQTKIIMITGASSGFGEAAANLLAEQGHKVIAVARRKSKLDSLAKKYPSKIFPVQLDITDRVAVADFFTTLPAEFAKIDVLINNAGKAVGLDPSTEADLDDWEQMIDTNNKGLLYCTKYALQIMKKNNSGLIINIGSVAATVPYKGGNVYGATKAFVRQFSRNLRADLFGTNLKITNIEPGMANTEFSLIRFKGDSDKASQVYKDTRALTADDIANTILWVINQPEHVNIDNIEIMPVDQTFAGMVINRS